VSPEANKALVRRYFEAIDEACEADDAGVIDEFLAADFVEHWHETDQMGLMQQLGVVPPPPA
jgi:hypothetical protein